MKFQYQDNKADKNAWREKTIIEYSYLVKHIAARFAMRLPSSVFFDELISAGSLGLIDAVDKFDASKHVSLKTYAQYRIKGAILDELRRKDTYSRSTRKKIQDITEAVSIVENKKGSPATDEEICQEMGISLENYYDILTNIHRSSVLSLDEFIRTKKNEAYSKTSFQSGIKGGETPADDFDKKELKNVLAQSIKTLTQKEQMVVSLYYYDELTLKEIGEVLSLTESRICQIHTVILVKLRSRLKDYFN